MSGSPVAPRPRRRLVRSVMRRLIAAVFSGLTRLEMSGVENVPRSGPLLVVANHFSFIDPLAMIHATPRNLEFLGGFRMPNAPGFVTWIPRLWGIYPVYRGAASRDGLRAAADILRRGGALGVFPEAGSWARVLRPARPGTAFLAAETAAPIVPMGITGLTNLLPSLRRGRRAAVTVQVGEPFGPFQLTGRGRERRAQLDELGHEIMRRIAALIPSEARGFYSEDQAVRAAAQGTELYPFAAEPDLL
jgi:1-acyl-sn-glycerol-3-phosphate acyltransferase